MYFCLRSRHVWSVLLNGVAALLNDAGNLVAEVGSDFVQRFGATGVLCRATAIGSPAVASAAALSPAGRAGR